MIDIFVEHYATPPQGFEDNLYNQLTKYIFESTGIEVREQIRLDVSNCFTQFWPEYPLGTVLVDTLSYHSVNVTVKMKDEEVCDVNYSCDYFIDYNDEPTQEVTETADNILYSSI